MSVEIPADLRRQLRSLRRRLWALHLADAACWATMGWATGFLLVFLSDRLWDTPPAVRLSLMTVAWVGVARVPWTVWRRVWKCRHPEDLARLLAKSDPRLGRPLLGVIELAASGSEQARSPALVVAAIRQVADQLRPRDLADSLPASRYRVRLAMAAVLVAMVGGLWLASAPASNNAWKRLAMPWADVPRFTFARLRPLPESLVVPHGEPFRLDLRLAAASSWRPPAAVLQIPGLGRLRSDRLDGAYPFGAYPFEVAGRIAPTRLAIRVGDFFDSVAVKPRLRPELREIELLVKLPSYLGREHEIREPIRGGTASVVRGSRFAVVATASRDLAMAAVNGQAVEVQGRHFRSPPARIPDGPTDEASASLRFRWQDRDGLGGADDFELSVLGIEDQPPSIRREGFPSQELVLDSDVVDFRLIVEDDFGVSRVGFEWETVDEDEPSSGERLVGSGGPEQTRLELLAAFSPADLGIDAQPILIRPFAEDYLPGRGRVYAEPAVLRVVASERHAAWVSDRLRQWTRASVELRDRERSLHERNRELRQLDPSELDRPEVRLELRRQATEEQVGARRLRELVRDGEELLREAMRNPQSDPDTVGSLASTMGSLKEIAERRMPTVADLLKQASAARSDASDDQGDDGPRPKTADVESTLRQRPDGSEPQNRQRADDADHDGPVPPTLGLPTTMVAGPSSAEESAADGPPSDGADERAVDRAVSEQRSLLEEFDQVAEELAAAIDGLEGSTFVKRLKAASRAQQEIASTLGPLALSVHTAPSPGEFTPVMRETLAQLQARQYEEARQMAELQSDLQAFFRRSLSPAHRSILLQMREEDPASSLRHLAEDLGRRIGLAIAETEFWSDTLDRWAEDLVPISESEDREEENAPAAGLPPKLVLEVLRVLDGEVKLRTQTRVADQARQAIPAAEHRRSATRLSEQQKRLRDRIDRVVAALDAMADEESDFAGESALLSTVGKLMGEAARLLDAGETGPGTIAAETEVIETMLQSNRFNPSGGGGGGGGSSPGGGGTGTTDAEAIALIGLEADPGGSLAGRTDDSSARHTTAGTDEKLPEEFRGGLHQYFNRIEQWKDR